MLGCLFRELVEARSLLSTAEKERDEARLEVSRIARASVDFADALVAERTVTLRADLEAATTRNALLEKELRAYLGTPATEK